jgi:hypothetical protein
MFDVEKSLANMAIIHLVVERDGKGFPVDYLPRGETVDAYQWERVPGVPNDACAAQ